MKAAFRAAGRSEEWRPADKRWRCVWCGSRVDVRLAAYPAARPDALDVIRAAALATRQPQPSRQEVQDALLALPSNPPLLAVRSFWRAYIDDPVIAQSRTLALQSTLAAISRALGRYHDEKAPRLIAWKFGDQ